MEYSNIKGYNISKMTLGTVQLGVDYGIANITGKPSVEKACKILDTADKGGINSFDTASAYGSSEEVIGNYFSSVKGQKEMPLITTKFSIDSSCGTDRRSIENQIRAIAESSIKLLGIDRIPIYLLHNKRDSNYMNQFGNAVAYTLKKLKKEGLVDKAGISVYSVREIEDMLEDDLYEAVQIPMNVFDIRVQRKGLLGKLKDAGKIVFIRSVFLQGLLFMDPHHLPESFMAAAEHLKRLHELANNEGISTEQLAVSFIRDMEGVTSLVIGAETPGQVEENIRLMNGPAVSSDTTAEIEKLSEKVPIEDIMKGLRLGWRN